ncbi:MAG: hypothetical protein GKR92_02260 [Gammaproteobacteria bacterium]|nr:MAG: hypothetical protein GKR92_02260 [Gammaproteobacteria bacterium]
MNGQSDMDDNFDTVIHEVVEEFEKISTTEDMRTGIDRRYQKAKDFPLKDKNGNVIAKDRRSQEDRRNLEIDIDDISEYTQQTH